MNLDVAKSHVAKLKARLRARTVLAVSLKSSSASVVLLREEDGKTEIMQPLSLPIGADAIVSDPAKAGSEFAALLEQAGIRERRCVVCIPPGWALTGATDLPEINTEDLRGYLELKAEREFPIPVSELRIAHSPYQAEDGKQRATIAAVPQKRMAAVEQMLEAAGCKAVSISLGLNRCVEGPNPPSSVHFLANGTHVDMVITAGGGIAALRSLSTPTTPRDPAFDAATFCREIRITLGRLPEPVRQQVRVAQFGGTPTSAESLCHKTREHMQRMGIENVDCAPVEAGGIASEGPAVESAERYLAGRPVAFEFVPPEVKKWQAWAQRVDSKKRRLLVAGTVGLVILPILALIVRSQIESRLESEWNAMRSNVAQLEDLQQKIRQFRPWFDGTPQTLEVLEALIGAFPDQGEVWAKSIQVAEGSKVTCTGFARSQSALMAMLDRLRSRPDVTGLQLQQVRGENPVQFSVTYKWEARHAQ